MSQAIRPNEAVSVEEGQVYKDSRTGDYFEVIYVDGNVYVTQNKDGSHRFGKRKDFEANVAEDRYTLQPEMDSFAETNTDGGNGDEEIQFAELDNIGEKGAENLREAGIQTRRDVASASDDELLDVPWIGEGGLESLRNI